MRNNRASPFYTISFVLLCAAGLIVALLLAAIPSGSQNVTVKPKPIVYIPPDDGREMYVTYCAPCHGMTGEDNGPAAPAFKHAPANLTILAKTHGGKYPEDTVKTTLIFGTKVPVHGDAKMPSGVNCSIPWTVEVERAPFLSCVRIRRTTSRRCKLSNF